MMVILSTGKAEEVRKVKMAATTMQSNLPSFVNVHCI